MIEKEKTDLNLGKTIQQLLIQKNVESPIKFDVYNSTTTEQKISLIESNMKNILGDVLGFDLTNDSVENTPHRVAKMFVKEIMNGLDYTQFPKIMTFENKFNTSSMVVVRNLQVLSLCGHHLQTIDGQAFIAYIPNKKIVGLSKFPRIVDFFSRRPQEQERLTLQIFYTLQHILETQDVAVFIKAKHNCMKVRGVCEPNSDTTTIQLGGVFKSDEKVRAEFYSNINFTGYN